MPTDNPTGTLKPPSDPPVVERLNQACGYADNFSMKSPDEQPLLLLRRILVGLSCVMAFMVMASVFSPGQSRAGSPRPQRLASPDQHAKPIEAPSHQMPAIPESSTDPHEGLACLGMIEDRVYTVHIYATDLGPRYTVIDNETGDHLGQLLSLDQVERAFPELQLRTMEFDAGDSGSATLLMLADDVW